MADLSNVRVGDTLATYGPRWSRRWTPRKEPTMTAFDRVRERYAKWWYDLPDNCDPDPTPSSLRAKSIDRAHAAFEALLPGWIPWQRKVRGDGAYLWFTSIGIPGYGDYHKASVPDTNNPAADLYALIDKATGGEG